MSELQITAPHIATVWASWRALLKALRGNALATYPRKAFEDDSLFIDFSAIVSLSSIALTQFAES